MSFFFSAASPVVAAGSDAATTGVRPLHAPPPLPAPPPPLLSDTPVCRPTNSACILHAEHSSSSQQQQQQQQQQQHASVLTALGDRAASAVAAAVSSSCAASSAAAGACAAAASASAAAVACPKPKPTLASTAALFLPDQSSPIQLAPSEAEIHSDPRYYTFGAQLVAALVLFSLAYALAYVILGVVRRRERRAKMAWKAMVQRERDLAAQRRVPLLRPTIYHVAPAAAPLPLSTPASLQLSDPVQALSPLAKLKRRVRYTVLWVLHWPARWRRRRRAEHSMHAHAHAANKAQKAHAARRGSVNNAASPLSPLSPPSSSSSSTLGVASMSDHASPARAPTQRRLSVFATLASFFHLRKTPGAPLLAQLPLPPDAALLARREAEDDAFKLFQLMHAFTAGLPATLPWLALPGGVKEKEAAPRVRSGRASIITDAISSWTASFAGGSSAAALQAKGATEAHERRAAASMGQLSAADLASRTKTAHASSLSSPPSLTSAAVSSSSYFPSSLSSSPNARAPAALAGGTSATPPGADANAASTPSWPRAAERSERGLLLSGGGGGDADSGLLSTFPEEENEREFLTYSLATFVLAVALLWLELLVLSVLASAGDSSASSFLPLASGVSASPLRDLYIFKWCTKELVAVLWAGTVWLSSVSLFVLAPFAFLYYEAEGIAGRKGFVSRVSETLLVLSAFTVLLYGSMHLLQTLLDRGGILSPFVGTGSDSTLLPAAGDFSLFDLFDNSALRLLWASLETLYSNIWHFLPGLLLLLLSVHHGFSSLIAAAYELGRHHEPTNGSEPVDAQSERASHRQRINVLKCELATAERKWEELELDMRGRSGAGVRGTLLHSSRAIAPASGVPHTVLVARRAELLTSIHSLRAALAQASKQEQASLSLAQRIWAARPVRKGVWAACTLLALLLTWHILLRVAQREARLIFRGSIFRWFRADMAQQAADAAAASAAAAAAAQEESAGVLAALMRSVSGGLFHAKNLLGSVLSMLTGRVLGQQKPASSAASPIALALSTTGALSGMEAPIPFHPTCSSFLCDSPLLSGLLDLFRVLCSVLLGLNGFTHPFLAFLADLSCAGFFMLAAAHAVYASPLLRRFSPVHALAQRSVDPLLAAAGEQHAGGGRRDYWRSAATRAKDMTQQRDSSSLLLFSPQFFTVNVALLLLLTSSLPLAVWMLGLSSFDLLEFYPHSERHFGSAGQAAAGSAASPSSSSSSSLNSVPLFVHLYNLSFLSLSFWHASRISKQIVLWVLLEQVGNVERGVERARVWLGWAKPNCRPEERFKLCGTWRRWVAEQHRTHWQPLTRWQRMRFLVRGFFSLLHTLLAPVVRVLWLVSLALLRGVVHLGQWAWGHVAEFVRQELADVADERAERIEGMERATVHAAAAGRGYDAEEDAAAAAAAMEDDALGMSLLTRSESSMASQLLAEVEAAEAEAEASEEHADLSAAGGLTPLSLDDTDVLAPLPSPSPRRVLHHHAHAFSHVPPSAHHTLAHGNSSGHGHAASVGSLSFFSRATSAPTRFTPHAGEEEEAARHRAFDSSLHGDDAAAEALDVFPAAPLGASFGVGGGGSSAVGSSDLRHFSPLYRSRTMSSRMERYPARSAGAGHQLASVASAFLMTPNLVPLLSRKLGDGEGRDANERSAQGNAAAAAAAATPLDAACMGSVERGVFSPDADFPRHIVTDADFPQFASPLPPLPPDDSDFAFTGGGGGGAAAEAGSLLSQLSAQGSRLGTPHDTPQLGSDAHDAARGMEPLELRDEQEGRATMQRRQQHDAALDDSARSDEAPTDEEPAPLFTPSSASKRTFLPPSLPSFRSSRHHR